MQLWIRPLSVARGMVYGVLSDGTNYAGNVRTGTETADQQSVRVSGVQLYPDPSQSEGGRGPEQRGHGTQQLCPRLSRPRPARCWPPLTSHCAATQTQRNYLNKYNFKYEKMHF